ncbi:MAG: WhiB family transcriptional regulator [Janthinobacterium lividum]
MRASRPRRPPGACHAHVQPQPYACLRRALASPRAACASSPENFWDPLVEDPLVEDPPRGALTRTERERQARLVARARTTCEECPLRTACLDGAVVRHDVAGFAGGTWPASPAGRPLVSARRSGAGSASSSGPRTWTPSPR